jgi:hypothetical protein
MTQEVLKLALEMVQNKMYAHAEMYLKEALAQEQWGASAVGHPAYVAEQKRKTEELRSRLESQEPVVVCCQQYDTCLKPCTPRGRYLAQRTWVGLTVKEVNDLYDSDYSAFHQRIEAKLKELNT